MAEQVVEQTVEQPIDWAEATQPPQPVVMNPYWRDDAHCPPDIGAEMTPEEGPRKGGSKRLSPDEKYLIATFCGVCTVRSDCLASALLDNDKEGIRGGLSQGQRKLLHKEFTDKDGTGIISPEKWDEAIESAVQVRDRFRRRAIGRRVPLSATALDEIAQRQQKLVDLLTTLPETTYVTKGTSLYDDIGNELGVSYDQAEYLVGRLAASGVIEKQPHPTNSRRYFGLKLVS